MSTALVAAAKRQSTDCCFASEFSLLALLLVWMLSAAASAQGVTPPATPPEEEQKCDPIMEGPTPPEGAEGACLGQEGGPDGMTTCAVAYTDNLSGGAINVVNLVTQTERTFSTVLGTPRPTVSWLGHTELGGMDGETGGPTTSFVSQSPAAKALLGHSDDLNLYNLDPGKMPSGLEPVSSLRAGSVEIGQLGLVWGERDSSYRGVTLDSELVIGRRYFSRLDFNGQGSVGRQWVHSFYERLIVVDSNHLRLMDWERPYNDPDGYFVANGPGTWRAPAYIGANATLSTEQPGAHYKVTFKSGRSHYYDAQGRIIVRADYSGLNSIRFRYSQSGLDRVTDSRGLTYDVTTANGYITSITDEEGSQILYTITGEDLTQTAYPARDVLDSNQEGGTGPNTVYRNTVRTFSYDVNGKLAQIVNDSGQLVMAFGYQPQNTSKIAMIMNPQGGLWRFYDFASSGWIYVATPRGFVRGHRLNSEDESVEIRQYLQSIDAGTPSRAIPAGNPGYWAWLLNRSGTCNCGAITQIVEPDGGRFDVTYDARLNITDLQKRANGGGTASIRYSWTWDSQDRVTSFIPPEAWDGGNIAGYTVSVTRTVDTAADNVGGEIMTISTPAGGIRPAPSVWRLRTDVNRRLLEWSGADHGPATQGYYAYYTYYPSGGTNSKLLKRHTTRRVGSIWPEFTNDLRGQIVHAILNTGDTFDQTWTGDGLLATWKGPVRGTQQYEARWYYDGDDRVGYYRWRFFDQDPYMGIASSASWADQSFAWDGGDNLLARNVEVKPGVFATSSYFYDLDENLLGVIDGDGKISGAIRDERDLPWVLYDGVGTAEQVQKEYTYNSQGDIQRSFSPLGSGTFVDTVYGYNQFDQSISIEVLNQNKVDEDVDAAGRVTRRSAYGRVNGTWAEIQRWEFTYADWHESATQELRIVRSSDGSQVVRTIPTVIEYAASGKPLVVTVGGQTAGRFRYLPWGAPDDVYDDLGNRDQFSYDPATGYVNSHKIITSDPVSSTTSTYERTLLNDPAGRVLQTTYIAQGQPSRTEIFGYDSLDNVVSHVDANGRLHTASYRYDGRLEIQKRDVVPGSSTAVSTEQYSWTPGGRIASATDNRQKTRLWTHDGRGRKTAEIQPDGSSWQWAWNAGGFLTSAVTPTGKTLSYGYNLRGLPTGRSITQGGAVLRTDQWTWAPSGHVERATKTEAGVTTWTEFARDGDGAVRSEMTDGAANTVLYTRDGLGRVTGITGPSGNSRGFGYDDHNRVTSLTDGGSSPVATMSYVGTGRALKQRLLRGGMTLTVDRDGFGRVSRLHTKHGANTLFDLAYDFDADGLLKWEHRVHEGKGDVFQYDGLDRMVSFVRESPNPAQEWNTPGSTPRLLSKSYAIDADHHRTSVITTTGGTTTTENYLTDPDRHQYTNVGGAVRVSSLNGSVTSHGGRTFNYDALEALTRVNDGGTTTATYGYDAIGRRTSKTTGGVTRRFVYAGPWVIEEYLDSGGTQILEALNYHASGVDEIVMSRRRDTADLDLDGNTTELLELYLHVNHQGSILDVTLVNGQVVESYRYDSFGAPTIRDRQGQVVASPPSGNRFLFTGREYDEETGLYHYRSRDYDPAIGGFLQEDPIGLVDGLNPVAYVQGNPLLFTDPYGTLSVSEAVDSVLTFLSDNAGTLADLAVDAIPFLSEIIDILSAVSGRDIRGWIAEGFKGKPAEMGWWDRAKAAASGAAGLLGSAIGTIAKLDKVIDKIKSALKLKKNAKAKTLANLCPPGEPGCFTPGTPILLADGSFKAIEEVQIGDEVACVLIDREFSAPEDLDSSVPDIHRSITPSDWRIIEARGVDSETRDVQVRLARPRRWIAEHGIGDGCTIALSLVEMGIQGRFEVINVRALLGHQDSSVHSGLSLGTELIPGRIVAVFPVTGTIVRGVPQARTLTLPGSSITVTTDHLLHSTTRGSFVRAGDLSVGETLTGLDGPVSILAIEEVVGPLTVHNLEVHRGHTYVVGVDRVLVHNDYGDRLPPFHYDKSSKNQRAAYVKAKERGNGREPDFDAKGHKGGPAHYHPIGPDGERIPGVHITWRGEWARTH